MNTFKNISIIVLILTILGLLYYEITKEPEIRYVNHISYDSVQVPVFVYKPSSNIEGNAKIIYRNIHDTLHYFHTDTVFTTKPFIAELDTVARDTFNLRYYFPENKFSLKIGYKPDTLHHQIVTITTEVEKPKEWYDETWFRIASHAVAILGTAYIMKK